ncbi:MAG: response regulator transcription factor [Pseudomonadota bacterium]
MNPARVALVIDDHPVTHLGCRSLLAEAGYTRINEATDAPSAFRSAERDPPDLIVLDLGLPGVGGLQMIAPLIERAPERRILVFSMNESPAFAARAFEAGAQGYLSKNAPPEALVAAVRTIERGQVFIERTLAISGATQNAAHRDPLAALTPREHQVLRLIGQGLRYEDIAAEIHVSYKTVANTCANLKRKLAARSLSDLIRIAIVSDEASGRH